MKRKKNIKKRILCIVSTMLLAFSVNAPITVSAFQLPDAIKDVKYYTFGDNKNEQAARAYWAKIKGEENV